MKLKEAELLPCPFCGCWQDNFDERPFPAGRRGDGNGWIARCGNPSRGAEIWPNTIKQVVAAWNRRVGTQDFLVQFEPEGAKMILQTYLDLHDGKLGAHCLWARWSASRAVSASET